MAEWNGCYCGEFAQPTIAPDEFGETCFHERGKCEVPPVPVPIETVLRLTRARAEQAEAAIARVLELCDESDQNRPRIDGYLINRTVPVKDIRRALEGDSNE